MASPGRKPGDALRPSHHPRADARGSPASGRPGLAENARPPADEPIARVDQRAQRTHVAAEPAGNQQADQQRRAGKHERPHPGLGRQRGRDADQRVEGQERLGRDALFGRQIVGIVRRPRRRRWNLAERPRAGAGRQGVDLLGAEFLCGFQRELPSPLSTTRKTPSSTAAPLPRSVTRRCVPTAIGSSATGSISTTALPASASTSTGWQPSHARGGTGGGAGCAVYGQQTRKKSQANMSRHTTCTIRRSGAARQLGPNSPSTRRNGPCLVRRRNGRKSSVACILLDAACGTIPGEPWAQPGR